MNPDPLPPSLVYAPQPTVVTPAPPPTSDAPIQQPAFENLPPPLPPSHESFPIKKVLIGLATAAIIFFVIAISLWVAGSRGLIPFFNGPTPTPAPTPVITPTPEPTATPETTPTPEGTPGSSGSPAPTPSGESKTVTITANPKLDGFSTTTGTGNITADIRVGRNSLNITRGFVGFDITSIPKGSYIESAKLRIYQTTIAGSPYAGGGTLRLDHMDFGPTLENDDFDLPALGTNIATITSSDAIEWKELTVTDALRNDIDVNRIRAEFRLHFSTEVVGGTGAGDFAYFESGENFVGTGNIPQLIVTYKK